MDKHSKEYRRYQRYLKSETWKRKKWRKLKQVGYKCENCGSTYNLECHHLHYDTLGKERMGDLQILCDVCHPVADAERKRKKAVATFATKKWGTNWQESIGWTVAEAEFDRWLKSKR